MLVPNAILKKLYGDSSDSNPLYGPANQGDAANPPAPAAPLPSLSPQNSPNPAAPLPSDASSSPSTPQMSPGAALLYGNSPNVAGSAGPPSGNTASAAPPRGSIAGSINAPSLASSPSAPSGATPSAPGSSLLTEDQFAQQNPDAYKAYLPARPVSPFDANTPHPKLRHALAALFAGMAEYGRPGEGAEMVNRWNQEYQNEANYDASLPKLKAGAINQGYQTYLQQGAEQAGIERTQQETENLRENSPAIQRKAQFSSQLQDEAESGKWDPASLRARALRMAQFNRVAISPDEIDSIIQGTKPLGPQFNVQADKQGRPEFIQTRTGQKIYPDATGKFTDPEMQKQWDSEMATHQQSLSEDPTKAAQQDWLAKHPGKGPADYEEYMKKIVPGYKFSLEAGGAGNMPLNPRQQATAQAIVEGRQTAPSGFALSTPYWQQVMGGVYQQDPQFNEQRAELRKDFTVGKHSSEINATNIALGHVGVLGDAIDALNNKNGLQVLNSLAQKLGVQTGSDSTTVFNTIVHRVGPELAKAYIGAGGSAGERGSDEKDFDPSLGPQQLKSNVGITAKLLRSKIGALENQWNQNKSDTMPEFQDRFLTPEAKQQLNKWAPQEGQQTGPAAGMVRFQDSQGGLHDIPKANLDKARQRDPGLKVIQ